MIPRPKVIVPPAVEPLSWTEAAAHLRITDESERVYVEALITAVRQNLEHRTSRAFIAQTLETALNHWPYYGGVYLSGSYPSYFPGSYPLSYRYGLGGIELPRATPLVSIASVIYQDSTGASTTIDPVNYAIDSNSNPGRLMAAYGYSWPSFTPYPVSPIRIRYVAGHVGMTASPYAPFPDEDIKHAMRFLVAHFYAHREAVVIGERVGIQPYQMELAVNSLLANHEAPNIF